MQTITGNVTRFERLGLEDGLSQGCAYAILQDSQGLLWIGTQDGLNKYDGYTFTVYRHDPTDPTSLSTNVIYAILEDSEGDLWLGTERGLSRFDKGSEVFTSYRIQQNGPSSPQPIIKAILEDSQGILWVGTLGGGLFCLDRRTGRWTAFQHDPEHPDSLASNNVVALLEGAHDILWVGTHGGGLGRLDRGTGEFTQYRHMREDPQSLSSNAVTALCEDGRGTLWIGTEAGGLNALDTTTQAPLFVRYQHEVGNSNSLSHDNVKTLLEDAAGTLWVGTGQGLSEVGSQRKRIRRHYHEEGDASSLSFSEILSLAEDAQGMLWIGTRMGLNKFDRSTRAFGHFKRGPETQRALSSNTVAAFLEDSQGFLWIGTLGGGLNRSTTNNTLTGFVHFDHREDDPHSLGDRWALPDADHPRPVGQNVAFAICEDAQGRLWIGTNSGLHRLVPSDDKALQPTFLRFRHARDNPFTLSHNTIMALAIDSKEDLWIATPAGLNRLNQADATQGFVRYLHDESDPYSLSHDFVRAVHADSAGNVWIGTNGGLNRLEPGDDSRFIRYQHDEQDPHSLSHDRVTSFAEDAQGALWIGTWGGLNRFEPHTGRFSSYREKDGLSNDVVYGVLVDDQGCLWLSTNKGINRFDPAIERFTHYDVHDGVQAGEFTDGAFYKDRLGRLYFGGINGFNVFHPDDIKENRYLPPVVLTSFLLANQPVPISESGPLKEHINIAEQIELAPEDYTFALEFAALSHRQPHKNRFAYKLEGFDRDWIHTGARDRKAVYTNIPAGTYTFRVKASNDDGLWNEEGASIQVTVSQPWWQVLLKSAFEGVVIHDQGIILDVNQAAIDLYGYEREEMIGQSIYLLVPSEARAMVSKRVSAGDETPYEATGLRKDGSIFVTEIRARHLPFQGRDVRVTAVRDITERKQFEDALRESESKFRNFVEQSSDGITLVNERGLIIEWNTSAERLTGLRRETVLNTPLWEVQVRFLSEERKTPDAGERYKVMILDALQTGEAPWLEKVSEAAYQRADGHERFVQQRFFPIETEAGFWLGAISTDITERREAEVELRKLSRAVEQSGSTIIITDTKGAIEFVNPAFSRITGYTAAEVIGQNPRLLKSEEMRPEVYQDLWATLSQGEVWEGELLNRKKNGQFYWESAVISPVKDDTGKTTHYVAVKEDITERKRAEAALQEAHDRLEQRVTERTLELQEAVQSLQQEVVHRESAESETRERLVVQQRLASLSTRLMQATEFEQAVAHTLAETGELVGATRVFLVRLQSGGESIFRIHEWCAPGVNAIFGSVEDMTLSGVPWLLEALRERGWFYARDMSQFPRRVQDRIGQQGVSADKAHCAVPVHAREEMIGFLGCHGLDPAGAGFQQHLPVLEVIAGILGSALMRERVLATLEQHVADRTQQLSAFFDLTTLASGEESLSELLAPAVSRILELGTCQAICVHLLDEGRTTLELVAQGNLPQGASLRLQAIALEGAFRQRLDQLNAPLVSTDLSNLVPLPPQLRLEEFQSYLGVRLRADGQSHGWVSYYRTSAQGFGLDESSLLVALAEQVGVIVENHYLRQRIEAAVTLEERSRLARDLHDSVTQSLYSLSLFARSGRDAAEEGDTERLTVSLTRLEDTSLQALREMRLLLYELRPETLEREGLTRTLEQRFDAVERRAGMKATLVYQTEGGPELPQSVERELYFLATEALNNTLKHAQAKEVTVSISSSAPWLRLEISDDGCGFDLQQVSGGYGLGAMRERMDRLGGELEISSAPEAGTRIVAQVDLLRL